MCSTTQSTACWAVCDRGAVLSGGLLELVDLQGTAETLPGNALRFGRPGGAGGGLVGVGETVSNYRVKDFRDALFAIPVPSV